ncbi:UNVERIFIED_CONTAM: putative mitochondrial protein [Sesamum angustifolium]|uniref:Mitochondrial protein n=1 Tax=Sesamum angustifolium TaxID=2727405 RepID=A0AAW2M761_9LAMI
MCSSKLEGGLGFRNLEAFNLALLAKQLWRLLTRPESLVYQVLKAKYFPHSHLFDATLGSRPSYTWRSIFTAMNLFRSGCRWRIGKGHLVNIWEDPWIPRTPSFRVITPRPLNVLASQVSELIDADLRVWNESLVNSLFWPEDRDLILQILLRLVGSTDLLVWHYSRNGLLSVRSTYHLALAWARPASSSEIQWSRQLWSKIWPAHMPNKAKVIDFAATYLTAFQSQKFQYEKIEMQPQPLWVCPPTDCTKINFDGGLLDGGRALGIGIIARNAEGSCVAWQSFCWNRGESAEMAEALAAREAIRLALRFRWSRVILEGDNKVLINKLASNQTDLSFTSPIVADVLHLSSSFISVSFSFVGRLGNSAADFLVGAALNQEGDASLLPPGLEHVILEDIAY